MPDSTPRPPRRAAARKKKLPIDRPDSELEGQEEDIESEPEAAPIPRRAGRKGPKVAAAGKVKPTLARAKPNEIGKRTRNSASVEPSLERDNDETPVRAPSRRGRKAPAKRAKSPTPEEVGEEGNAQEDEDDGGDDKMEDDNTVEGEGKAEKEEEEVKRLASRKRKATEQEVVAPLQPQLDTPARTPSTPSVRQSRQTTPVAMGSRVILPQGTPKPKPSMRAAAEGSTPTSDNKRSLAVAFPEGTGNTPDRRRPASLAFLDEATHTSQRRPSMVLGSPSRAMAIGSPSRMRRSTTPQVLQSVAEPQSPSLSQQIPPSAQVPQKMPQMPQMPQMPLSSQHAPYTQAVPPVTQPQLPASQASQQNPDVPRQRTVITHLVMTNFKSYAGRQEVGPFHPSFSSVVGPNGSGKSNVIDSLLFVFGFRASKMRQGKISALIHNSAGYMDLQFCEVEVHFQEVIDLPGGAHEVIPNSTLIIARRAFKNNSSRYTINGKESNFTQVTTLLRDRGVDLDHKRFLILQGEVESIAQMKPKGKDENDDGLLEYLEDIIGTSKYKKPIEDSAAQVEALNEVCLEKSTRVHHVEKEKNALEDKKNLALDFIKDENELGCKQATLYQVQLLECTDHINVTSELVTQVQAKLDEELEMHKGNEEGIKKLEKKYNDMTKEIESIERDTAVITKEQAKYDKENVKLQEKKKFLVSKEKKLQKAITTNRLATSEAVGLIDKHQSDLERLFAEVAAMETRLKAEEEELERVRNDLKDKTQVFSDQITVKQKQLEPWNEKINQKQSAIAVTQSELDILHQKREAAQKSMEEFQTKIELIHESRKAKELEHKERRAEKIRLEKEIQKTEAQLDKISQQEVNLRNILSGARQKAEEARASLAASQNQGNVLTGLMRLKESGRIDGFHNRLGNLGTIDAKYDVAISTACPALDNLVVESVEVGQHCIEYLRKNNLGRANFICLDRLQQRDMSPIQTPEDVPRLFDLIKPRDLKFAPAFYNNLYDTLVAKDLTQANRIAYGARRWRVVTLEGQLIDTSGTMSGGGTRVIRGKMSSKQVAETTREAVTKLESERDAQEKNYQACLDEKRQLQEKLRDLKERLPELDVTMSKIELEVQSGEKQIADAEKRIQELSGEHKVSAADRSRVTALEKQIQTLDNELTKLRSETSSIEEDIKALQDKIMEVGGVRLRSQKAKVDGLREQIETLNEQHLQADIAKTKAEKTKVKVEKAFRDSTEELETVTRDMEELEEEIKAQAKAAEETKARVEEAQHFLDVKKDELEVVKDKLDGKKKQINATRAVEIEMKNKLEQHQKGLADHQRKFASLEEKMGKLTMHQLKDYGVVVREGEEELGLPQFSEDELRDIDKEGLKKEIAILEARLHNINVDLSVLAEYRRRLEEHTARTRDLNNAVVDRDNAKKLCDDLRKRRLEGFMEGFSTISLRLKEMYQMITMGGNAELELVDSLDPFSEGILFSVMPPKKSWKNISNLSGGEKTLSSLALVFALHHYKPTPLYVMDEIDAALDFRNVSIVAAYIKERTKNAQFIVISLRNNMFELAARLVGVYKVNHMTKSITIENNDYLKGRRGGLDGNVPSSAAGVAAAR